MKSTTQKFKQIMASGQARNYQVKVKLTLVDGTILNLTEDDMWTDTFKIETASSGISSFDLGSAIIGQCSFALNNFDERFNQYDFFNATAVVDVKLVGDTQYVRMGFYTVDEPEFSGALINLVLLDNMWKFDVPLSNVNLSYPISCQNAINAVCQYCGMVLQTQQFYGYNFQLTVEPEQDMNCREFLQYVAMITCNFCIINTNGDLELKWYDTASIPSESDLDGGTFNTLTTPYSDGDSADGGNFLDYTSGDSYDGGGFNDDPNVDYFTRNFTLTVGTDTITITGVKVVIDDTAYTIGSAGYVLELENPLIDANNVNSVLNLIWTRLSGFTLRTFNLTTASDLAVEVGDCCAVKDYKGNFIYSWVTNNTFAFNNHSVQCNAVPPTRQLSKYYSKEVATAVEIARKHADEQISDYDLAVQRMNLLASNAMGLYWLEVPQNDGTSIFYQSDKPLSIDSNGNVVFTNHSHVWKMTGNGFFQTASSGTSESNTTWTGGIDANNNAVMNTISTIGLTADWIRTGTLEGITLISGTNTGSKITIADGRIEYRYNGSQLGELSSEYISAEHSSTGQAYKEIKLFSNDVLSLGAIGSIRARGTGGIYLDTNSDVDIYTPYGKTVFHNDVYIAGELHPTNNSSTKGIDYWMDALRYINISIEDVERNSDGAITNFSIRHNDGEMGINYNNGIITSYWMQS